MALRATSPDSKTLQKTPKTTQKSNKKKKKKNKKTKNTKYPKKSFSIISQIFLLFLVGVQNFPFLTTWPKSAHPKNTIKIWVSARHFLKTDMRHETAIFGQKQSQIQKFQLSLLFCLFLLFQQQKNTQN